MKFKNVKVYGLNESIIRSGYPHQLNEPADLDSLIYLSGYDTNHNEIYYILDETANIRSKKLAATQIGSGHDNFLKGIIVQFDLKYPQYFTPQLQRYHWIDIISSQSKMHKLTKITDLSNNCNKYVTNSIIAEINNMVSHYNNASFPINYNDTMGISYIIESKKEMFQYIISNLPMGFELWMGISTNYLQLKTIYNQRCNHKLEEWKIFCDWIKTLPYADQFIINDI